ncbi:hypothetical protein HK100_009467 [Physocladia obscura]|uniref:Peptidase M20 dimerisation domain-containing protein n=1 Tax=Physocladia obscura TaxID=109957 RepID=A0AAD5SN95_9FUNG|nr:hypothetical protein HK100_009467 [Physocladia obscura]
MTKEHEVLLPTRAVLAVKESNKRAFNRRQLAIAFLAISAAFFVWIRPVVYPGQKTGTVMIGTAGFTGYHCDQVPALVPDSSRLNDSQLFSPEFAATAAKRLSQAVQIPTVSFDNMTDLAPTVPDASVHLPFLRFHTFLENAFPLVHKHLLRRVINKYSLLYSWKGTNHYAAPLILMAHIDVVPVLPETANLWTHDPFSGYIDHENGFLWGRGAGDTKATVLGTLEAVEALLKATNGKYLPNSDIYLAFGHDEEISGYQGAKSIADYLQHDLGLAGKVGLIVDEGPGFGEVNDVRLATVGTGEKG